MPHKLTKKIRKQLRILAGQMPVTYYDVTHKSYVKGEELLKSKVTEVEGKPVDPEKVYVNHRQKYHLVNHKNRITRAFESNGWNGVTSYVKQMADFVKDQVETPEEFPMPKVNLL